MNREGGVGRAELGSLSVGTTILAILVAACSSSTCLKRLSRMVFANDEKCLIVTRTLGC